MAVFSLLIIVKRYTEGTHEEPTGLARWSRQDETDMRMRAINTLQCVCFVAVAVLLAIGGLLAGNLTVALVAAVSGIACAVVKLVIMRAWLKYTAR